MDDEINYPLKQARAQRYVCLRNLFNSLDAFVIPSTPPYMCVEYEKLKAYLLEMYGADITEEDLRGYRFLTAEELAEERLRSKGVK